MMTEVHPDFGPAAEFSEHRRGDHISYREAGSTYSGIILWVAAAYIGTRGQRIPARYIVERHPPRDSFPDIVFFNDVCIS